MVAAATALSLSSSLVRLPQGGSVCIGMLPIFLYPFAGAARRAFASFAYGLLQLIFDGAGAARARPRC